MRRFTTELKRAGVEMAVRKSRGLDISAACGQLRVERLRRRAPAGPQQHGDVQVA
jgi:23S rRNA (adenine2503-C2)-methyltransferase